MAIRRVGNLSPCQIGLMTNLTGFVDHRSSSDVMTLEIQEWGFGANFLAWLLLILLQSLALI